MRSLVMFTSVYYSKGMRDENGEQRDGSSTSGSTGEKLYTTGDITSIIQYLFENISNVLQY